MARVQRAALAAGAGGVGWAAVIGAWVFVHGSTQSPRGGTLLGLDANQGWALLAVPAALMAVALGFARPAFSPLGIAGRLAHAVAMAGCIAIAFAVVLQVAIVDPDLRFDHPAVQGGWWLYLAGLFPGVSVSMVVLGGTAGGRQPLGAATVLVGLGALLPIVGGSLHGVADGSLGWDLAVAALDASYGVAWLGFAAALRGQPAVAGSRTAAGITAP